MNADKRVVPEKHVNTVLDADSVGARTQEMKNQLKDTHNPLMRVAGKWMEKSGESDPLSRVMIRGARQVQKEPHLIAKTNKKTEKVLDHGSTKKHTSEKHETHVYLQEEKTDHAHESKHTHAIPKVDHHDSHTDHHDTNHGHGSANHAHHADKHSASHDVHDHRAHHNTHHAKSHDAHHDHHTEHGNHAAKHHDTHDHHDTHHTAPSHHHPIEIHGHGHGHEEHHGHDAHGHSHGGHGDHGHGHDDHGHGHHGSDHGHGNEHGHGHGHGHFSSFVSTGHWFGDQGAYIFGMIGRIMGEIIGYIAKLIVVLMIFGPTRTALLAIMGILILNNFADASLPIWISAGVLMVIHLILNGINQIAGGGGGHEGHGGGHGGGHGHDDHGHGGGHGHH